MAIPTANRIIGILHNAGVAPWMVQAVTGAPLDKVIDWFEGNFNHDPEPYSQPLLTLGNTLSLLTRLIGQPAAVAALSSHEPVPGAVGTWLDLIRDAPDSIDEHLRHVYAGTDPSRRSAAA
jgi:hypothetical protein